MSYIRSISAYQFHYFLHELAVRQLIEKYYGKDIWHNIAWDGVGVDEIFNFFTPTSFNEFLRLFRKVKEEYGFNYGGVIDCDDFSSLAKAVASLLGFNCMFKAGGEIIDERNDLAGYHAYNVTLYCLRDEPAECMSRWGTLILPILFEPQTDEVAAPQWDMHFYIYGLGWVKYITKVIKPW